MKEKASQLFSEQGKYMLFTRHALTGTPESVFMTAHLMPRGEKPYNEDVITATQIYFPGPPNLAVAMLGIEKVTDNTQVNSNAAANSVLSRISGASGETKTNYKYHMWTKTESEKVKVDGEQLKYADTGTVRVSSLLHAGIGFVFDDFVVRHITIRYKTFPEVFSEIGGLWAGCGALLWLVWSNSGHLRKKKNGDAGSEMIIFKYIPFPKWRTAWLKGGVPKDTVPV